MKHVVSGFLLALSMAIAPSSAFAQAKIRIAIWDFENNAATHGGSTMSMGPAARNHIDTAFSEIRSCQPSSTCSSARSSRW